ncbi:putative integrase [Limimaricola cinnabarinus LL-001]|uniref:Putative integrase n=1 Tax=Limimaricola cinnabarinus LL-001 TaxID=1337093 RepID=U3AQU5_9RHOB|nr:putative integrase [Limimaricola cinnabarinus LL-001]
MSVGSVWGKRVWKSGTKLPHYLNQRRRRWYAELDIPKKLRPLFNGKARFVESLKTESRSEAERRAPLLVARWKAEIEAAKTGNTAPLEDLRDAAMSWRELLDREPDPEQRGKYEMILSDKAVEAEERQRGAGEALYKLATRQWVEISEKVEDWLLTLDNEPKTLDMKRSDLSRFSQRFRTTKKVTRKSVQLWVHELQHEDGLKAPTARRIISACRGYWGYLQRLDIVPDDVDPFREVVQRKAKKSKADVANRRKSFTAGETTALLDGAVDSGDLDLGRLIALGMWTGCRVEELCALQVHDVQSDRFKIVDAKSEAGWREVPIHSQLRPLLQRLCAASIDGYVLSGLTKNKYGDRSNAIGKRFGRLKSRLGFDHTYVFHSIRKTVATQFDAAGIPEAISARIIGHDIPTMTYGVYSGGAPFEKKQAALEVLAYPSGQYPLSDLWPGGLDS